MNVREVSRSLVVVAALAALPLLVFGSGAGTAAIIAGLTGAAIVFLIASGLSLIFGLLDVLNLAHGAVFMLGLYVGAVMMKSSQPVIAIITVFASIAVGSALLRAAWDVAATRGASWSKQVVGWKARALRVAAFALAAVVVLLAAANLPSSISTSALGTLKFGSSWASQGSIVAATFAVGLVSRISGLVETSASRSAHGLRRVALVGAGWLTLIAGSSRIPKWFDGLGSNFKFLLIICLVSALGWWLGKEVEAGLLRRFYKDQLTQVIITFLLLLFLIQAVQFLFGRATLVMARPDFMNNRADECVDAGLWQAIANGCSSFQFGGSQGSTYRLLIIIAALAVWAGIWLLLRRSRLGIRIQAGVEDAEMLAALGVDVPLVFNRTFALGSALAAAGGAVAGPFLGASSGTALIFLIEAVVVILIGGKGNITGAALGALMLGLWLGFADTATLSIGLDPAFGRISVLAIFAVLLILKPLGVLSKAKS